MSDGFDRRRLIAAAVAAVAAGWCGGCDVGRSRPLLRLPNEAQEAGRRLGAACRRALGDPDVERLWRDVEAAVGPTPEGGFEVAEWRARVGRRIEREMGDGASVEVDGLLLAPTEARLLALLAAGES